MQCISNKIQISVLALHGKRSERFSTILVFVICCYNEDITMAMGLPLWLTYGKNMFDLTQKYYRNRK